MPQSSFSKRGNSFIDVAWSGMVAEGALFTHDVVCFLGRPTFEEGATIRADNMRECGSVGGVSVPPVCVWPC